ncbi:MAG: hypothetical protein H0X38_13220 [Planctomycetes bacterium]|nr:hypothetical protein [Planctomycetota bacterium]
MSTRSASWPLLVLCLMTGYGFQADAATAASPGDPNPASQRWLDAREVQRKGRASLHKDAEADKVERAKKAVKVALELVAKARDLRVPGQDAFFARVTAFIGRLDRAQAETVTAALKDLPAEPANADAKLVREWTSFMSGRRTTLMKPTETLGDKALGVGVYDIAHECLDEVLAFDPDSPGLRKALNLTRVGERWYGPKDMELVKAGLVWDDKLGWIVAKEAARYAAGDYFDVQAKRWTTLAEANAAHATLDKEWLVQTEHLEIRGNAPLAALVGSANALEGFYAQIFAAYCAFFAKEKGDVKLIFGLLDHPRLLISIASDKDSYVKSLPSGVAAGWSAGMWIPAANSSFFFAGPKELMFHEFTHQILGVFSGHGGAPVWVVEGAAVYTQSPTYDADGRLVLGVPEKNRDIRRYLAEVKSMSAMPLDQLFAIDYAGWLAAKDPGAQYAAAGAVVQFCMEAERRRFRADFIDYLRDAYLGQTQGHAVWDYLGMTRAGFASSFASWAEGGGKSGDPRI